MNILKLVVAITVSLAGIGVSALMLLIILANRHT